MALWKRLAIVLGSFCIIFLIGFPVYWAFISSISPRIELFSIPPHWIPNNPTLINYQILFFGSREIIEKLPFAERYKISFSYAVDSFWPCLRNTVILAVSVAVASAIISALSAYVFKRFTIRGKNLIFVCGLIFVALPPWASLISLYTLMSELKLIDTLLGLFLLVLASRIPLDTWLMTSFYEKLPKDLEDAAFVDGCSKLSAFTRVILPVIKPGIAAVSIIAFLGAWGNFLIPLIFSTSLNSQTLTVMIAGFFRLEEPLYEMMCAASILTVLPPLIFVAIFERYIEMGMLAGAVKG